MLFKTRIAELLAERGLKQADLCRMANVSTALMSYYVNGKMSPALDKAKAIATALDITLDELVGWEPKPDKADNTDSEPALTEQEADLLRMFRELDDTERQEIFNYTEFKHSQKFLREQSSKEAGKKFKSA